MRTHERLMTAMAVLALGAGCGSKLEGTLVTGVTTVVDPQSIVAGETGGYACELQGDKRYGRAETTIAAEPADVLSFTAATDRDNAGTVTGTQAGTYVLRCGVPFYELTDTVGATLTVVAGPPVRVRPDIGENPLQVQTTTTVTCVGEDAYGNAVGVDAYPAGDPSLSFVGSTVTPTEVGTFTITCELDGLESGSADLVVVPGPPALVDLRIDPPREAYKTGQTGRLYWVVTDTYGNPTDDKPGALTAPATTAIALEGGEPNTYRFLEEGRFTFSVVLDAPLAHLTDTLTVTVDETGPNVVITWPERGATIDGDGTPVTIEGFINDAWGEIEGFTINNVGVSVNPDGSFAHPVEPKWGINLIEVNASDTFSNSTKLSPTFQYSTRFLPFVDANAEGLKHNDGMVVLAGQQFFDDGVHDPSELNDLATLLTVLLEDLDVATLVSGALAGLNQNIPIVDFQQEIGIDNISWLDVNVTGALTVTLASAETSGIGATTVNIDSRDGGLDWDLALGDATSSAFVLDLVLNVRADVEISAAACSFIGCLPPTVTTAFGQAQANSGLDIGVIDMLVYTDVDKVSGQPLNVTFRDFNFSTAAIELDPIEDLVFSIGVTNLPLVGDWTFDWPLSSLIDLNGLNGLILDPLVNLIAIALPPLLNPLVESVAGPLIAGLFNLIEVDLPLPLLPLIEGGESSEMDFYTALDTVDFTDDGGTIGLAAGFHSEKGVDRNPHGAITRDGCLGAEADVLGWQWERSIAFGLKTDMLNSALFAAWWTGYINSPLDLSSLGDLGGGVPIPIDNLQLDMTWLLPPTLNDCTKGAPQIQIGDLFIVMTGEAFGSPIRAEMYADISLGAGFTTDAGGLSLEIGSLLFADIEVVALDDSALPSAIDLRSLLEDGFPALLGSFLTGQTFGPFTIPATDLSTTVPGLPAGTSLGLGNLGALQTDGYVIIGGDLQ